MDNFIEVGGFLIKLYIYMFLHEDGSKLYFVPYQENGKWGCLAFVQRKGKGQRHQVVDVAPEYFDSRAAREVAKFVVEEIINMPKKFDISEWKLTFFVIISLWILKIKLRLKRELRNCERW